MKRAFFLALIAVFGFQASATFASLVTDSFNGSFAMISPQGGDQGTDTYTINVSDTQGCVTLAYDIVLQAPFANPDSNGNDGLHFDSNAADRGFGDTGGSGNALQGNEELVFSIQNLTITPLGNSTFVSSSVVVQIDSFDLVNNGNNPPIADWTDNLGGSGSTVAGTGGAGVVTTETGISAGATQINVTPGNGNWFWINNVVTSYAGDVVVDKPENVPEPSSILILTALAGTLGLGRRRIAG